MNEKVIERKHSQQVLYPEIIPGERIPDYKQAWNVDYKNQIQIINKSATTTYF